MLIITPDSHLDHGLSAAHLAWLLEHYKNESRYAFIDTVELPVTLPAVNCALWGPVMGDAPVPSQECVYAVRGNRGWSSRLTYRPPRPVRQLTVIAGLRYHLEAKHGLDGNLDSVLYTAFGGPLAPREPGDPECVTLEESQKFWAEHALAMEP